MRNALYSALILVACVAVCTAAGKKPVLGYDNTPLIPGQKWRVHDISRPHPRVVEPGETADLPPSDAIVLFDGTDLSHWLGRDKKKKGQKTQPSVREAKWDLKDGYMECNKTGSIWTKEKFGSCQLHIEWCIPEDIKGEGQKSGNSGVFLMGLYEIQVLNCYENVSYADGMTGAMYGQHPPLINACRKPGEWQSYDIVFEAPEFDGDKLVKSGYMTVLHNGVLLHHKVEILGATTHKKAPQYKPHAPELPLQLQDHGNPVRFRNIWIREITADQ